MKTHNYRIETSAFDSSLYGQPWIATADFSKSTDTDPEPLLDYYGLGAQPFAGFYPDNSNDPGSAGCVRIDCEPGTILCHGITRKKRPGAKAEVSRLWYIAGDDGEAISLLPMGGFDAARRLAAESKPQRLDRFRTVKSIERGDGGAGMVGKPKLAPGIPSTPEPEIPGKVTLEFEDYQALQRSLCRSAVDCEQAIKLHSCREVEEDAERKERRAGLVASYERELADVTRLKAKLRKVFIESCPGRMVQM